MKKILILVGILIGLVLIFVVIALGYLTVMYPKVSEAPRMSVEITQERIDRGKYLANHVMLCLDCHAERDWSKFAGPVIPGTEGAGGEVFDHKMGFPGRFVAPNITPANLTTWTDGELFRVITTGVKRDGEPIFPLMPYPSYGLLDEEDIKSVIAYLRTIPPVHKEIEPSKPDFPMTLIMRTIPKDPEFSPRPDASDKIAHGEYLVTAAACNDCHTNSKNGKKVGETFAGGFEFRMSDDSIVRAANITPHETGIGEWTEEYFISRFKEYAEPGYVPFEVEPRAFQTVMPWKNYGGMTEEDLSAIYAYLKTIPPAENRVELFTAAD